MEIKKVRVEVTQWLIYDGSAWKPGDELELPERDATAFEAAGKVKKVTKKA